MDSLVNTVSPTRSLRVHSISEIDIKKSVFHFEQTEGSFNLTRDKVSSTASQATLFRTQSISSINSRFSSDSLVKNRVRTYSI